VYYCLNYLSYLRLQIVFAIIFLSYYLPRKILFFLKLSQIFVLSALKKPPILYQPDIIDIGIGIGILVIIITVVVIASCCYSRRRR